MQAGREGAWAAGGGQPTVPSPCLRAPWVLPSLQGLLPTHCPPPLVADPLSRTSGLPSPSRSRPRLQTQVLSWGAGPLLPALSPCRAPPTPATCRSGFEDRRVCSRTSFKGFPWPPTPTCRPTPTNRPTGTPAASVLPRQGQSWGRNKEGPGGAEGEPWEQGEEDKRREKETEERQGD